MSNFVDNLNEVIEPRQISSREKSYVLKRDKYACRYCGNKDGPFEFDHVYPYVKGGETSVKNIVLACYSCNRRKRDSVGLWPMPIGYFEEYENIERYKLIQDAHNLLISEAIVTLGFVTAVIMRYFPLENLVYVVGIEFLLGGAIVFPQVLKKMYLNFSDIVEELKAIRSNK